VVDFGSDIAVSGLLWGGPPRAILAAAGKNENVRLFSSPVLLAELRRVLDYPRLAPRLALMNLSAGQVFFSYLTSLTVVEPDFVPEIVERDPDDNHVVAAALAANADVIVSGDDDLISLGSALGIPVLTPKEASLLL
jgi:putative PIN family toxin of toxin-antitoxin system